MTEERWQAASLSCKARCMRRTLRRTCFEQVSNAQLRWVSVPLSVQQVWPVVAYSTRMMGTTHAVLSLFVASRNASFHNILPGQSRRAGQVSPLRRLGISSFRRTSACRPCSGDSAGLEPREPLKRPVAAESERYTAIHTAACKVAVAGKESNERGQAQRNSLIKDCISRLYLLLTGS